MLRRPPAGLGAPLARRASLGTGEISADCLALREDMDVRSMAEVYAAVLLGFLVQARRPFPSHLVPAYFPLLLFTSIPRAVLLPSNVYALRCVCLMPQGAPRCRCASRGQCHALPHTLLTVRNASPLAPTASALPCRNVA